MPGTDNMEHWVWRGRGGALSPQVSLGTKEGEGGPVGVMGMSERPPVASCDKEQVLHRNIVTCSAASKPLPQFIYGLDLFLPSTEFFYMRSL